MQVDGGPLPHLHENCLLDAKKTISADSLKLREMSCGVQIQTGTRKSSPRMLLTWFTTEENGAIGV